MGLQALVDTVMFESDGDGAVQHTNGSLDGR